MQRCLICCEISTMPFVTLRLIIIIYLSFLLLLCQCLGVSSIKSLLKCDNKKVARSEFPSVNILKLKENGIWKEKVVNESATLLIPGDGPVNSLELVCSASYPVQWSFMNYQKWIPWVATSGREDEDYSFIKVGKHIFKAWLRYPLMRNITQLRNDFPTCHKTTDKCVQTSISVNRDGKEQIALLANKGTELPLNPDAQFGKNVGCKLRMAYDEKREIFYCQSLEPNTTITMFPSQCSNPVDCRSIYMDPEESCLNEPKFSYENCTNCAKISYSTNYLPSVAICLIRGLQEDAGLSNSVAMPFFYSIPPNKLNSKPTRYLNWNDLIPTDMMEITNFDKSFYAGDTIYVNCNTSYYYFGSGIRIEVERILLENGTDLEKDHLDTNDDFDIILDVASDSDEDMHHISISNPLELIIDQRATKNGAEINIPWIRSLSSEIKTKRAGNYQIACKAPVWNSTEWIFKSVRVTVLESTKPRFISGNGTETLYYKPDSSITCVALGVPKPNLIWTEDGRPLPSGIKTYVGEQNDTRSWITLKFPNTGIYGNFTCSASNAAGTSDKMFIVIPNDKSSSMAIFLIAFLGVLGMVLIPAVVFLVWKVRQQKKQLRYLTEEEIEEFLLGKPDYIPFQSDMSTYAYYLPYDRKYEIPKEQLEIDFSKILGSGAYGMVIFGFYKNPQSSDERMEVAVKTSKPMEDGIDLFKALLSELKIMTYIGRHENIVNLIGACTQNIQKREVFIALEFCENGNLLSYLRTNRHSYSNPVFQSDLEQPSFIDHPQVQYVKMEDLTHIAFQNPNEYANVHRLVIMDLLRWAYEIAEGMYYLATKKVIHGDLAARNILLTNDLKAKIGDFGLSKRLLHYNSYTRTATTPLPLKWLALECLQDFQFSAESDIWSFGITIWEIFSLGEIPYSNFNGTGEEFLSQLSRGMRLSKPSYCVPEIFDVMMSCWRHDRKQRPTFDVLSYYFKKYLEPPKELAAHPLVALRLSSAQRSFNEMKQLNKLIGK